MLSRNWLRIAALGGCLIGLYGSPDSAQSNPYDAEQQTEQQESAALLARNGVIQTVIYEADCRQPANHDAADYCQQVRMAQAAEDAVWWARFQTFLGVFGLAGVVGTLIYTARATDAASRAAKVAENTILIENRPWISLGEPQPQTDYFVSERGAQIGFLVPIRNVGRGPAHRVFVTATEIDIGSSDPAAACDEWVKSLLALYVGGEVEEEVVFPDAPYGHHCVGVTRKDTLLRGPVLSDGKKLISPTFAFAALYQSSVDRSIHYTVVGYMLGRIQLSGALGGFRMESEKFDEAITSAKQKPVVARREIGLSRYTGIGSAT